MTKAELIERVHAQKHLPCELTKKTVGQIIDAVFTEVGDYFIRTRVKRRKSTAKLTYPGFGTFSKRIRNQRTVKNPQTGVPITIEKLPPGGVEVVPDLLAVTAERVKQAVTAEIPALANSSATIHVGLLDNASPDGSIGIPSSRFADGWRDPIAARSARRRASAWAHWKSRSAP